MIQTEFNGNFGLDEIKCIQLKNTGLNSFYEIRFVNDKRKLYACKLHCFLTDDGKPKILSDLKVGDKIWVDISAFSSDKSLK